MLNDYTDSSIKTRGTLYSALKHSTLLMVLLSPVTITQKKHKITFCVRGQTRAQ